MRWVRYHDPRDGRVHHGRLEDDGIMEIEGDFFGDRTETGRRAELPLVKLLPPVIPPTFYAAGINYREHVKNAARRAGQPVAYPPEFHVGYRAVNALVGSDDAIVVPKDSSGKVQFEGELVVVIGSKAKHLSEKNAFDCVFGYTIGNDVSERTWQAADRTFWRSKNADTFKPMGPWIETDIDLDSMRTRIRLNGKPVSDFGTNDMIFRIPHVLATMTRYLTLMPGDVVWMGTDDPCLDMVPGDTVEIELDGIGVLRNPVKSED